MSASSNPFLGKPMTPEVSRPVAVDLSVPSMTGPVAPQSGVAAPHHGDLLPVREQQNTSELWWLGTHGGAGESSLSALVPEWLAADHAWPRGPGAARQRVVLVARSNMRGLRAAQTAATQWAAGLVPHIDVLGLVVVADAPGRIPRPLRDFAQVVSGGVPRMWTVPWIESWRLGEPMALPDAPRGVSRLIDDLTTVLRAGATGTNN